MHIPDGYLGPTTSGFFYVVMAAVWAFASKMAKKTLKAKQVPLLAIGAAFSFLIMMFNVPIPGGTTGHAVGGVLVAILLGPWAACIAVTVALVVQALLFGDGGIHCAGCEFVQYGVRTGVRRVLCLPFDKLQFYRNFRQKGCRRWNRGILELTRRR